MNPLIIVFIACLTISSVKTQDQFFCNTDITPVQPSIDPPIFNDYAQYQAAIERNENSLLGSEEFIEYYDGLENIGISAEVFGELNLFTYSYYAIDQMLIFYPYSKSCVVKNISDPDAAFYSPFPVVYINGTEHILSPLNSLLKNPGFKFVYIGKNTVRGMPVDQWQTCSYSKFELATYNITVSFTDPDKWKPAAVDTKNTTGYQSIPVEIVMYRKKDVDPNNIRTIIYTITDFKPSIDLDIEQYTTPGGIYCEGRKNLKPLPELPHSFAFETQVVEEFEFNPDEGLVSTIYEEYSYKDLLFQYAYDKNNSYTREIHDYNTGLKYIFNQFTNGCEVKKITLSEDGIDAFTTGLDIKLKDPAMFFDYDLDNFQFTGFKRRDGVNTDVYIGLKTISAGGKNLTAKYEWHFMSNGWNRTDVNTQFQTPMYLKVYLDAVIPNTTYVIETVKSFHIFNWREPGFFHIDLTDFDLSKCGNAAGAQEFYFFNLKQDADLTSHIQKNMQAFRAAVADILRLKLRVTPLRVGNIQVKFQDNIVFVLFTLHEKSSYYGDVSAPKHDEINSRAARYLKEAFRNEEIVIRFNVVEDGSEFVAPVDKDSLKKIDNYEIVYVNKSGFSQTTVALAVITVFLNTILLGVGITCLEKRKTIQILKPFY